MKGLRAVNRTAVESRCNRTGHRSGHIVETHAHAHLHGRPWRALPSSLSHGDMGGRRGKGWDSASFAFGRPKPSTVAWA